MWTNDPSLAARVAASRAALAESTARVHELVQSAGGQAASAAPAARLDCDDAETGGCSAQLSVLPSSQYMSILEEHVGVSSSLSAIQISSISVNPSPLVCSSAGSCSSLKGENTHSRKPCVTSKPALSRVFALSSTAAYVLFLPVATGNIVACARRSKQSGRV